MISGYAGKILSINLTTGSITALDTENYAEFGGGNGIGAALFWELCQDKAISGLDPGNVMTAVTSPLTGTLAPFSRMEICGISPISYPVEWFSRSNIGGYFATMLKHAGWDGIAITGRADKPVWINIMDDKVTIEAANGLWGLDTIATQKEVWRRVTGKDSFGDWLSLGERQTTQGPTTLCIGPGGESLCRMGTIQQGGGMGAQLPGFGAAWGAKNLKAISVLGTHGVKVADPKTLIAAREQLQANSARMPSMFPLTEPGRSTSCSGCFMTCKHRVQSGAHNDAQCLHFLYSTDTPPGGKAGSDIIESYGLQMNDVASITAELHHGHETCGAHIYRLYQEGVLGPGKEIDSAPLPMEKWGTADFTKALCQALVSREGIGADLAEGLTRASKKWGRLEQDLASGLLDKSEWGYGWHWDLPTVDRAYGSLMDSRDTNEMFPITMGLRMIGEDKLPAEKTVEILSKKVVPYTDDPFMFDHNWQGADGSNMKQALDTGIYSRHKAKLVAWTRRYTRFWGVSMLACFTMFPKFIDANAPDFVGPSPELETGFYNAVTGQNLSFADSLEIGRKIWNLNRAIWALQGRHRDMEHFSEFMYTPAGSLVGHVKENLPRENRTVVVYKNGQWAYTTMEDMYLDKAGLEQWKTHYYEVEGWDPATGWPTRKTLEELGLKKVADTLEKANKLGSPS